MKNFFHIVLCFTILITSKLRRRLYVEHKATIRNEEAEIHTGRVGKAFRGEQNEHISLGKW